jgi:hypothetical protein
VARALDKVGLAACKTNQNLNLALGALKGALKIRCEILGPSHVDSIDTLNNIAGVRFNRKEWVVAAQDYLAVFSWREQVFGRNHPSVAVTAHTLASIYDCRLFRLEEAREFYVIALQVYQELSREKSSKATVRVANIQRQLNRLQKSAKKQETPDHFESLLLHDTKWCSSPSAYPQIEFLSQSKCRLMELFEF